MTRNMGVIGRVALFVLVSGSAPIEGLDSQVPNRPEGQPDLALHFERYGVEGTFVLYDSHEDRWTRYNPERAADRFIPASTFKVFNSLVALETGVIEDDQAVIPWDGLDRGSNGWNQDQTLATAFERSAVWVYQELARRIGDRRMQEWIDREGYGNTDISGGIDRFWLDGGLRISANEQIALLRRLYASELGFSERTMRIVRRIMISEDSPEYTLRTKTGWARLSEEGQLRHIGWLIGWVERQDRPYFFAMNLESEDPDFPMREARPEITYGILGDLGIVPSARSGR